MQCGAQPVCELPNPATEQLARAAVDKIRPKWRILLPSKRIVLNYVENMVNKD